MFSVLGYFRWLERLSKQL